MNFNNIKQKILNIKRSINKNKDIIVIPLISYVKESKPFIFSYSISSILKDKSKNELVEYVLCLDNKSFINKTYDNSFIVKYIYHGDSYKIEYNNTLFQSGLINGLLSSLHTIIFSGEKIDSRLIREYNLRSKLPKEIINPTDDQLKLIKEFFNILETYNNLSFKISDSTIEEDTLKSSYINRIEYLCSKNKELSDYKLIKEILKNKG